MLVVDDGSPDGTGEIADELAVEIPGRVEVMHRTGQRGLGRSYMDGLRNAIARPAASISSARWTPTCRTTRSICPRSQPRPRDARPGDRIAVPERRQRRELAAPPHLPQHVREPLHPHRDRPDAERLHERLSLLAARGARAAAARRDGRRTAMRSSSRCCTRHTGAAAGSAKCRSSSSNARRATRRCRRRAPRIADHAVAAACLPAERAPHAGAHDAPGGRHGHDVVPALSGRQRRHVHGADRASPSRRAATRCMSSRPGIRSSRASRRGDGVHFHFYRYAPVRR